MGSWKVRFGLLAVALLAALVVVLGAGPEQPEAADEQPAEIIVRFDRDAGAADRADARADAGTELAESLPVPRMQVVETGPGVSVDEGIEALEQSDAVSYAEPNVRRSAFVRPNDTYFSWQWGLEAIDAPAAWERTTGSQGITVAVIDSGVEHTHPDLAPNVWRNPGETGDGRETNRVDDDGNQLVDDWQGWDWVQRDNTPADGNGHGTHVAGTVAARGNDGAGVSGVAWRTSILPLRVLNNAGEGRVSDVIRAYAYAGRARVRLANASLGGPDFSQGERDALAAAPDTLFVVAAGNESADNDATPSYPCNHDLENVVCVAATDANDVLAGFSNRGRGNVDLAAPGVGILSTWVGASWDMLDGTSMATPHAAGAAALVWAQQPDATVAEVRRALLGGVDVEPALAGQVATGGRLNADRALQVAAGETPPTNVLAPSTGDAQPAPSAPPGTSTPPPATEPAPVPLPVPAPAPAPAPGAAPDATAPTARIAVSRRQRLATVRRRGVRTRVRCSEACTLRARLILPARTAKRLRVSRTIGTARSGRSSAGAKTFYVRLTRRAKARLRRIRRVTPTLNVRAMDPAGNARTVRARIAIVR